MTEIKTADYCLSIKIGIHCLTFTTLTALILAGCTAFDDRGALFSDRTVRVEPASEAGYDYRFSIINGWGFNYHFKKKAVRAHTVSEYLSGKCKSTKVIRETRFQQGTYIFGKPKKLYMIDVKCFRR